MIRLVISTNQQTRASWIICHGSSSLGRLRPPAGSRCHAPGPAWTCDSRQRRGSWWTWGPPPSLQGADALEGDGGCPRTVGHLGGERKVPTPAVIDLQLVDAPRGELAAGGEGEAAPPQGKAAARGAIQVHGNRRGNHLPAEGDRRPDLAHGAYLPANGCGCGPGVRGGTRRCGPRVEVVNGRSGSFHRLRIDGLFAPGAPMPG